MKTHYCPIICSLLLLSCIASPGEAATTSWKVGKPIVTYWAGPSMTDAAAEQMVEGGFNLVWCGEKELDVVQKHGLRAMIQSSLLNPAVLDNAQKREQLDAFIGRVASHPALYAYFITDEPNASQFPALGRLVDYLRLKDPAHMAYINLFPTYASNDQLGNKGDGVTAYKEHLKLYLEQVKPGLVSYDHYQFALKGDNEQYFLNLSLVRRAALDAGLPFLNIVQACTWAPQAMRIPNTNELRYLVYTTVAYGAQGISYYVYAHKDHYGSIANMDGTPGPLYHALKNYNREFVAIASELQPLTSLGVYHTALKEKGCEPMPIKDTLPFGLVVSNSLPRGFLLGCFGDGKKMTHALVVNLDYTASARAAITGPGSLEAFDALSGKWSAQAASPLDFAPGGGRLLRVAGSGKP